MTSNCSTACPGFVTASGFGRLAFGERMPHYSGLIQKVQAELEAGLDPSAMTVSRATTGFEFRTNRPRVYIAAGLGGGTGSGMFVDLAYTIRARLIRLGYPDPEVVGLLHAPPDGESHPQTLANVYAGLTELHQTMAGRSNSPRSPTIARPTSGKMPPRFESIGARPGADRPGRPGFRSRADRQRVPWVDHHVRHPPRPRHPRRARRPRGGRPG